MGKATREAYGNALARIGKENTNIIVLDADLSKSTKTDTFKNVLQQLVKPHLFLPLQCLQPVVRLNKFAMLYVIQN